MKKLPRRKAASAPETIIVGLLPQVGGLELLSWTVQVLARPGDIVLALVVSISFSTFLLVQRGVQNGAQRQSKVPPQLQLGEIKEFCKKKQIQMDVKFAVGDNAEKVVIEQATAFKASTLVVGTTDGFVARRKRSTGCYYVRNAPPGCSVLVVRNGKIVHFKNNPFKVLTHTNKVSTSEDMHLPHLEQQSKEQSLQSTHVQALHSIKALEPHRKEKYKSWFEQKNENSPRGVLEGSSALCPDSDSSSSFSTSFSSHTFSKKKILSSHREARNSDKGSRWRDVARLWKARSLHRLMTFPSRVFPRNLGTSWSPLRSDPSIDDDSSFSMTSLSSDNDSLPLRSKTSWKCFTFHELQSATCNFSSDNFIGSGGYAEVYKGSLADGELLAVKRLTRGRQTEEQRVNDFLTELGIIVHINHPNTARLIGFGVEGGLHLVFEFFPHGSLASLLHGTKSHLLDWNIRYKVALGTARGLLYLHEGCQRRIIHRDIKASNILLAENFDPQISDFGLAKWLPKPWTHLILTAAIEGTFGYLAPEYVMHGIVDEKTDVFAFGVLLLELVTGRLPIDSSQESLVMWAKPLLECRNIQKLVDPCLGNAYNAHQLDVMASIAALCVQQTANLRPSMKQVFQLLNGEGENIENSEPWTVPLLQSPYLQESLDTGEYTSSTRYLTDLNRHKEVALQF